MPCSIQLTVAAREDLNDVLSYIRRDAPQAADALTERFVSALESLSEFPERCPIAPDSRTWGLDVRYLLVFRYRVLYHIHSGRPIVTILRILHGSRLSSSQPPPR